MNPLLHPVFRYLFTAQLLSLLGIGIMTVGLALKAYELGGVARAGQILGAMFALKMVVYVLLAPLAEAWLSRFRTRPVLITLDLLRLLLLLLLAVTQQFWQLLLVSSLFYTASAAFTPLFQAAIPAVLNDEKSYTSALVLSRLAYTFESLFSPILAALALLYVETVSLFPLAALCLAGSALALFCSAMPASMTSRRKRPWRERVQRGLTIYFLTPRLRGLFVLNLALSIGLAWVLVNTVVHAAEDLGDSRYYTWLMGAYGGGSAAAALCVPRLLRLLSERTLMLAGCLLFGVQSYLLLLDLSLLMQMALWAGFGMASSLVLTPGGLVLTHSAEPEDHPAVFAAQFSMSHAGWLLAYPLAGWLAAGLTPAPALAVLGSLCLLLTVLGAVLWPSRDPLERVHQHPELPGDHPHLQDQAHKRADGQHSHVFHIDDLHLRWNP